MISPILRLDFGGVVWNTVLETELHPLKKRARAYVIRVDIVLYVQYIRTIAYGREKKSIC